MLKSPVVAISLTLSLLVPELAFAAPPPIRLRWNELAPLVVAQTVEIALAGGAKLRGQALAIRDDTFVLDCKKVSNSNRYSKGNVEVPRTEIVSLTLIRYPGSFGSSSGALLGGVGGVSAGTRVLISGDLGHAAVPAFFGAIIGGAWAGHRLGKKLDARKTPIVIIP